MSMASAASEQSTFWHRQFASQPTTGQIVFDLTFGIALPLICLYLDPIVFRATGFGEPLLAGHAIVAGVAICLGFLSLASWMLIRWPQALFAGLLAGSALFAALLGLVLLPFSLMGLFVIIGIFGFSPFVTAFVFWRNAVRAYRRACETRKQTWVRVLVAAGLAVSCGAPLAVQGYVTHEVSRAMDMVLSSDQAEAPQGLAVLKLCSIFASFDQLAFAYETEEDQGRRDRLAAFYRELTGEEIEHRLAVLRD